MNRRERRMVEMRGFARGFRWVLGMAVGVFDRDGGRDLNRRWTGMDADQRGGLGEERGEQEGAEDAGNERLRAGLPLGFGHGRAHF